jgi:hypothetical protein
VTSHQLPHGLWPHLAAAKGDVPLFAIDHIDGGRRSSAYFKRRQSKLRAEAVATTR